MAIQNLRQSLRYKLPNVLDLEVHDEAFLKQALNSLPNHVFAKVDCS